MQNMNMKWEYNSDVDTHECHISFIMQLRHL